MSSNTKTTLARGSEWGSACLRDGWGPLDGFDADDADNLREQLAGEVVRRFHAACNAAGRADVRWYQSLSEVHGLIYGTPSLDLEKIREECTQDVFEMDIDGLATV